MLFVVADTKNWRIPASDVPEGYGSGGFAPYGVAGIIKGAAVCFYGFIGKITPKIISLIIIKHSSFVGDAYTHKVQMSL